MYNKIETFSIVVITIYIKREIDGFIDEIFSREVPCGLILAGIVGCGKTTTVQAALRRLSSRFSIHEFTGDDVTFRNAVGDNGRYILDFVRSKTQGPALVFVDEVQKSEAVFDALKLAFDNGISFIVSGSNPQYLSSTCRRRLQRRAEFIRLLPLSLPEILKEKGMFEGELRPSHFVEVLDQQMDLSVPNLGVTLTPALVEACHSYFARGGLPLAHMAATESEALRHVQFVVERGFDVVSHDNSNITDIVRSYLAASHSREFAYQGLFQRTGIRNRKTINDILDELAGHGYLTAKRPVFPGDSRRSYLVVYSYIDPGIVSYLSGNPRPSLAETGARLEGMVHVRLENLLQFVPLKTHLGYFKPFTVDQNEKTKFLPGEIDFVYERGKRLVPLEVKLTSDIAKIDTTTLEDFVKKYKTPFGIVLYGGVPQVKTDRRLIYWPYWMI